MGRLTTYDEFGEVWIDYNQCVNGSRDVIDKLAHYEDLGEQGRLVEVIKCSECEHYDNVGCADGCGWCDYWDIGRFTDGYCDKAKLKELEGDHIVDVRKMVEEDHFTDADKMGKE